MLTARQSTIRWFAAFLALQLFSRFVALPPRSPGWVMLVAMLSGTVLFMLVAVGTCGSVTDLVRRPGLAATLLLVGVAGWALVLVLGPLPPNPPRWVGGTPARWLSIAEELFRLAATFGLGILVASVIRESNILLPAAVFAAIADLFIVYHPQGTVHQVMQTPAGQQLLQAASAKVPTMRGLPIMPLTIGPADFVFMALFLSCAHRFGLEVRRTVIAFVVVLTLSLVFVMLTPWPVPALLPMSATFLVVNWRHFKLSRQELQAVGAAAVIVLGAGIGYLVLGSR